MPRKPARGRGRYNTASPTVSVTGSNGSSSGRRAASTATASASTGSGGKAAAAQVMVTKSGRQTKNSNGNRRRKYPSIGRRTPVPKSGRRGRKKDSSNLQDPTSYKSDDGVVYKPGDYAYVDSQQPELPNHICIIKDFKLARKDAVIAEVKWFYRVTELPEAVYLLLMEDRKSGKSAAVFDHPQVKDRELFMAFNKDTHPATLFRGKCYIKKLDELGDKLTEFLDKDDSFFFSYGYKPESRRLTLEDEESYVPTSQQAVLPECICANPREAEPYSSTGTGLTNEFPQREEMVWNPQLSDDELLMYLRAARSIALHAGVCMTGMLADGYLAASSDETTQHAFDVLHRNGNNTENAMQELIKHPIVSRLVGKKNWSKEDALLFSKGMRQFGKNFFKINTELLPGKQITELVEYYYFWKKTDAGLNSRNTRRQRKTAHIRLSRALLKPREVTPDKEFVDWSSCDEDEGDSGEDKKSYYACHHCFTRTGVSWHHAGPDKAILCDDCRVHFKNYGLMRQLVVKGEPPEFIFKDFHEIPAQREDSSTPPATLQPTPDKKRKTRNSNGTRGAARPGLRSAKTYTEKNDSDDDEEADASESSESSEYETPISVSKPKPLQARRSILDNLDECHNKDDVDTPPPPKRQKREHMEVSMSEEEGSMDSGNGNGTQKFPNRDHSPGEASTSSANDEEGGSPYSSSQASPRHAPPPQHFSRVTKDRESSCARTDLVYLKKAPVPTKASAFSAPGTSAHGGHPSDLPTPTANVKVPIITPHAPQLPRGPPSFMNFPQGHFAPPGAAPPQAGPQEVVVKRSNSRESNPNREREHQQQLLQHQQQQQQQQQQWLAMAAMQAAAQAAAQGTPANPQLHPSHAHFTPVTAGYPVATPTSQVHHQEQSQQQTQQPMVFTFPTQDEIVRQRLGGQLQGTPEQQHYMAALMQQQGLYPTMIAAGQMEANRLHEEQHGMATPQPPQIVVPMEQYMLLQQQQQQQQQQAAIAAGLSPIDSNQTFIEFQRFFENTMQQVQKDPNLLQQPQVQHLVASRNAMIQQLHMLQAAGHDQHQINGVLQQHLIRIQQDQVMFQAHAQQQEAAAAAAAHKQKIILGRPPAASDNTPNRSSRPGVIVGK